MKSCRNATPLVPIGASLAAPVGRWDVVLAGCALVVINAAVDVLVQPFTTE